MMLDPQGTVKAFLKQLPEAGLTPGFTDQTLVGLGMTSGTILEDATLKHGLGYSDPKDYDSMTDLVMKYVASPGDPASEDGRSLLERRPSGRSPSRPRNGRRRRRWPNPPANTSGESDERHNPGLERQQDLRDEHGSNRSRLERVVHGRQGRVHRDPRAVGLRQVHASDDVRGSRIHHVGDDYRRWRGDHRNRAAMSVSCSRIRRFCRGRR